MIMVDVTVPAIGRKYNFQLDEQAPIAMLIVEIAEVICQKENCMLEGDAAGLILCSMDQSRVFSPEASLSQYGIADGNQLLLV